MALRPLSTAFILLLLVESTSYSDEGSVERATQLVETAGNDDHRQNLNRWRTHTKYLTWKDSTGNFKIEARYLDSSDTDVTLERKSGGTITVAQNKLDFNSRVRIKTIKKAESEIIDNARAIESALAAKEDERKRGEALEKQRRDYERLLTPGQREIRKTAKELSQAGIDREKALLQEIVSATGSEEGVRFLQEKQSAMEMLHKLTMHYQNRTLSAETVKKLVNEYGGRNGSIWYLERIVFGKGKENIADVLVEEYPLITRLDIYYAAGRVLRPEVREAYGFNQIALFERMGEKYYWDYIHEQRTKAKAAVPSRP